MKKQGEGPAWADEAEAREREMLLAVWRQVRPVCYATRWLDQIREAARKSPDGAVHMWTELRSQGRQEEDPPVRRGYVLEYRATPRHGHSHSSDTTKEQFTVHQWESTETRSLGAALSANTKLVTGDLLPPERWTVARFLGQVSYDPYWHLWFRGLHWLALTPGPVQHDDDEGRPQ